jgi:carboxypeptidase C (cathepsin A)
VFIPAIQPHTNHTTVNIMEPMDPEHHARHAAFEEELANHLSDERTSRLAAETKVRQLELKLAEAENALSVESEARVYAEMQLQLRDEFEDERRALRKTYDAEKECRRLAFEQSQKRRLSGQPPVVPEPVFFTTGLGDEFDEESEEILV